MKRILLTWFEPFGRWSENSSALCVSAVERRRHIPVTIDTVIYPVHFVRAKERLERDLQGGFDFAVHLGQHEGSSCVRLERVAHNTRPTVDGGERPLLKNGPPEFRTSLPLGKWSRFLRKNGIPSVVSHDAGCYVCNAVFYWSLYLTGRQALPTRSLFIHIPLASNQIRQSPDRLPSLETEICADAVEIILKELAERGKEATVRKAVAKIGRVAAL